MSKYKPFIKLGPGDTIKAELEFYGWDQADLAEILDVSKKHVSELINNKVPITFDMACRLSKVFQQSPQFWLNLDAQYRLRLQEDASEDQAAARALIFRYMPVRDMRRKDFLPKDNSELVLAVLDFWNTEVLNFDHLEKQAANFRKSDAHNQYNVFFALTWLQAVRNAVKKRHRPPKYDRERLREIADNLADYTRRPGGVQEFLEEIADAGVVFVYAPHFEKTYTDGASFWHKDRPVLAYTARYDRIDNFWFTVAHELAHILKHAGEESPVFIDSLEHLDEDDAREKEADEYARRILKIPEILRTFRKVKRVSRKRIEECAEVLGLHPAIVVGALQHAGRMGYESLNALKQSIRAELIKLCEDK